MKAEGGRGRETRGGEQSSRLQTALALAPPPSTGEGNRGVEYGVHSTECRVRSTEYGADYVSEEKTIPERGRRIRG